MIEDDDWTDWDSGPVSRPYMVTGGRTRQRTTLRFDLIDLVARTPRPALDGGFTPERRAILLMCEAPITVADLAAELQLPLGVVRIILDDLVHDGLIDVRVPAPRGGGAMIDRSVLERVLEGIRALLSRVTGTADARIRTLIVGRLASNSADHCAQAMFGLRIDRCLLTRTRPGPDFPQGPTVWKA